MSATPDKPGEATSDRELALERLRASRVRLRRELVPDEVRNDGAAGRPFNIPRRLRALWRSLRRGMRGSPMATVAMTALQEWWHGHPWRATGELVAGELHASLTPVVRRHPVATMLASAALGLTLMFAKPWRWPAVRRQVQPLPARMGRWLWRQLGAAPGQALLSALLVMMARQAARPAAEPQESPPASREES